MGPKNHLVLARKYRPKSFQEVVGQDLIVATLKASIEKGRVAHALLFTGGRGIGKTTIARIVAKALVCLSRSGVEPCGVCAQCLAIDNFSSLDVVEIDGASHTGVDDIRDLRDSARYQPSSARLKIFIIDEVHMLSISAFNALLKILEEPPPHVMFIFATTEVHKIPKTILSRCQRYDFKRMPINVIHQTLKQIMATEGFNVADEGLLLIAKLADGGMRDALSMAEQIVSEQREYYSAELIAEMLGVVSHRAVKDICCSLMEGEVSKALMVVKEVYDKGLDLCQVMDAMAEQFRVWSLCAHVESDKAAAIIPSLTDEDFLIAQKYDKADLKRLFAIAIDGMAQVFSAQRPLLALELFVLRAALRPPVSDAVTISYCLQKLDAIIHNRPLPKEPMDTVVEARQEKLVKMPPANAQTLFHTFLQELNKVLPAIASHLRHARPAFDPAAATLSLFFEQSLHYEQALRFLENETFKKTIADTYGQPLKVAAELKKADSFALKSIKTVAEAEQQQQQEDKEALHQRALDHPLVKKALEIFGGDITQVKRINHDHRAE